MILVPSLLPIQILLNTILDKYLNNAYCITVVSESPIDFHIPVSFTYIDVNTTSNFFDMLLYLSDMGCSDYIVQMRDPQMFMESFDEVNREGNVRRSDKKIIIIPLEVDESQQQLLDVFSFKESSFVANLLLVTPTSVQTKHCLNYDLITHKFVGMYEEPVQPEYLDKWDSCTNKFERNANLFPHDMRNLQGKILKVAGFTYKPYVLLDLDTNVSPLGRDGTEIKLVNEFCRWINCTIKMVRDDKNEWGEIYENRTGIGVMGNVVEDRADVGISALYSWYAEFVYLDFTAASIRTAVTCIAPAPRLLVSWAMPLLPFSWYMWLAILLTFIYVSLALTLAKGCSSDKVLLTTFGLMISQSYDTSMYSSLLKWRVRHVTGWLLVYGLILDNAYTAGLATTFTVPKYEQAIDTIKDITNKNMEWGATHDAWVFSLTLSEEPIIKQLVSQFRVYDKETLKRKSLTRNMAFSIEKLPAGSYAVGEYITEESMENLMLMLDDFYYEQCVAMLRKSSPYTAKLSDLIGRLHESGLLLAWETQVALKYLNFNIQLEMKLSRAKKDADVTPLGLRHVMGVFIIYFFGIIITVIVFIVEIVVYRKRNHITLSINQFR